MNEWTEQEIRSGYRSRRKRHIGTAKRFRRRIQSIRKDRGGAPKSYFAYPRTPDPSCTVWTDAQEFPCSDSFVAHDFPFNPSFALWIETEPDVSYRCSSRRSVTGAPSHTCRRLRVQPPASAG